MATLRDRIGFLMFHQFREGGYGARSGLARKVTADFFFWGNVQFLKHFTWMTVFEIKFWQLFLLREGTDLNEGLEERGDG